LIAENKIKRGLPQVKCPLKSQKSKEEEKVVGQMSRFERGIREVRE